MARGVVTTPLATSSTGESATAASRRESLNAPWTQMSTAPITGTSNKAGSTQRS
jgi:hypothetical protein